MNRLSSAAASVGVAAVLIAGAVPSPVAAQRSLSTAAANMRPAQGAAEAAGTMDLQRLTGAVTLDGFSAEAAWTDIQPLALTMYEPTFRGALENARTLAVKYTPTLTFQ